MTAGCGRVGQAVAFGSGASVERLVAAEAGRARMLTTADVCEQINVCVNTVYSLVASGKLPAVKVGRDYRYTARDVQRFLDRHDARVTRALGDVAQEAAAS